MPAGKTGWPYPMRITTRLHRWPRSSMSRAAAVLQVERLVHRFLIGEVDLRTHRARDPAKRRWTGLPSFAVVQRPREEVRDQAAKRLAFPPLAAFEIPQNGRVNIDRRSWHDE